MADIDLGAGKLAFCLCDADVAAPPFPFEDAAMEALAAECRAFVCTPHVDQHQRIRIQIGGQHISKDMGFRRIDGGSYALKLTSGRLKLHIFDEHGLREEIVDEAMPVGRYSVTVVDVDTDPHSLDDMILKLRGEEDHREWTRSEVRFGLALFVAILSGALLLFTPFVTTGTRALVIAGSCLAVLLSSAATCLHIRRSPRVRELEQWRRSVRDGAPKFVLKLHRLPGGADTRHLQCAVHRPSWAPWPPPPLS